jgi:hypothetical protein
MEVALLTVVDSDEGNPGDGIRDEGYEPSKRYESEAVACFRAWRKSGGKYADIPIYALHISGRELKKETLMKFKLMDVTYIKHDMPEVNEYDCGYFYVPIGLAWLESQIKEDFLIHIDIDMMLVREPTEKLLFFDRDRYIAKIAIINEKDRNKRFGVDYSINFNTCFITSYREDLFYKTWYTFIKDTVPQKDKCDSQRVFSEWEEFIVDEMHFKYDFPIEPIDRIMVGQYWDPIFTYSDKEFQNIFFLHDHYGTYERTKTILNYYKRRREIDRRQLRI